MQEVSNINDTIVSLIVQGGIKYMKELIEAIEGNPKAIEQFQRIVTVMGSCMNVGEIKFKSCIFSAQVSNDLNLIMNLLDKEINGK